MVRSQSGPLASVPFTAMPTSRVTRIASDLFRVLLLRRLRSPLPLCVRFCQCGRLLDVLGHHRAACMQHRRSRGGGARVSLNAMLRDLDIAPFRIDNGRARLVVIIGEVGGRLSDETKTFLWSLACADSVVTDAWQCPSWLVQEVDMPLGLLFGEGGGLFWFLGKKGSPACFGWGCDCSFFLRKMKRKKRKKKRKKEKTKKKVEPRRVGGPRILLSLRGILVAFEAPALKCARLEFPGGSKRRVFFGLHPNNRRVAGHTAGWCPRWELQTQNEARTFVQLGELSSARQALHEARVQLSGSFQVGHRRLSKPNGGVRGIVAGDVIRRLAARTVAKQLSKVVKTAPSPFQHALSTKARSASIVRDQSGDNLCVRGRNQRMRCDFEANNVGKSPFCARSGSIASARSTILSQRMLWCTPMTRVKGWIH